MSHCPRLCPANMVAVVPAPARPPTRSTIAEAAGTLRRILAAVDAGELEAAHAQDVALVRRLQGALAALEAVS